MRKSVGTFINPHGFICYANSLVQCLIEMIPPLRLNLVPPLKLISEEHKRCSSQSLQPLCALVGRGFDIEEPNCPAEFLSALLENTHFRSLKPSFEV